MFGISAFSQSILLAFLPTVLLVLGIASAIRAGRAWWKGSKRAGIAQQPPAQTVPVLPGCIPLTTATPDGKADELTAADLKPASGANRVTIIRERIHLPIAVVREAPCSLTLIATQEIVIDGTLTMSQALGESDLVMICRNGPVIVTIMGEIKFAAPVEGAPATGAQVYARAAADDGSGSGSIFVSANLIAIAGSVSTRHGAGGGKAEARGQVLAIGPLDAVGGEALAHAGSGDRGGNIALCAVERIVIDGSVIAGRGAAGGDAKALAENGSLAVAVGGNGGHGGSIRLAGLGASPGQVDAGGLILPGGGGKGGDAKAIGGNGTFLNVLGGMAIAGGGHGGTGGIVTIVNLKVAKGSTPPAIHLGYDGNGGMAEANGGTGAYGRLLRAGSDGGDASADGGDAGGIFGGAPSPSAPVPPSGIVLLAKSPTGKGGNADATSGGGGWSNWRSGGNGGIATATGGDGPTGVGVTKSTVVKTAPPAATPQKGGPSASVKSPGM